MITDGTAGINHHQPIFMSGGSSYMMISATLSGGPSSQVTTYLLPGQLPCLNCYGSPDGEPIDLGIEEPLDQQAFIYPNPATTEAFFELPSEFAGKVGEILLFDGQGRLISHGPSDHGTTQRIDVQALAAGIYSLYVTISGQVRVLGRVIVVE